MNFKEPNPLATLQCVLAIGAFIVWLPVWPVREFVLRILPDGWASLVVFVIPPLVIIALILLGLRQANRGNRTRSRLYDIAVLVLVIEGATFFTRELKSTFENKKCDATLSDIGVFNDALEKYRTDVTSKRFPDSTLIELISDDASGWLGPYMATITSDPWNNHYAYISDGSNYTIQSIHERQGYYPSAETIRYVFSNGNMESIQ